MKKISYKVEQFEGPLDLLLSLVAKNKISIIDINISDLLEQYLEYIKLMQVNDMDIASEFLEMSSRLLHMKSLYLLPKHEHDKAKELEQELKIELISYKECKEIAERFWDIISFDSYVRKPEPIKSDMTYKKKHNVDELLEIYIGIKEMKKASTQGKSDNRLTNIMTRKIVSVSSKIEYVLKLVKEKEISYDKLILEQGTKSDKIATFLAVLELIKKDQIRIYDSLGELWIRFGKKLKG